MERTIVSLNHWRFMNKFYAGATAQRVKAPSINGTLGAPELSQLAEAEVVGVWNIFGRHKQWGILDVLPRVAAVAPSPAPVLHDTDSRAASAIMNLIERVSVSALNGEEVHHAMEWSPEITDMRAVVRVVCDRCPQATHCYAGDDFAVVVHGCDTIHVQKTRAEGATLCTFSLKDGFYRGYWGHELCPREWNAAFAAWKQRIKETQYASWDDPILA